MGTVTDLYEEWGAIWLNRFTLLDLVYYVDLNGKRPEGHPTIIKRDRYGRAVPEPDQVWVDYNFGSCWRIHGLPHNGEGVSILPYKNKRGVSFELPPEGLETYLFIWDDYHLLAETDAREVIEDLLVQKKGVAREGEGFTLFPLDRSVLLCG